jgi:hypothetical protein
MATANIPPEPPEPATSYGEMDTAPPPVPRYRYQALMIMAGLFRLLAILTGASAALTLFLGAVMSFSVDPLTKQLGPGVILYAIVGGFIAVIVCLACAELIKLAIDMETNTRRTAQLLFRIYKKWPPDDRAE